MITLEYITGAWLPAYLTLQCRPYLMSAWILDHVDGFAVEAGDSSDRIVQIDGLEPYTLRSLRKYFRTAHPEISNDEPAYERCNHISLSNYNNVPSPKSFGVVMSSTSSQVFVREANNFEYSLEQEYINFAMCNPTNKTWDTFERVKISQFVPAVVECIKLRLNVVEVKTITYNHHTNGSDVGNGENLNASFCEYIMLVEIGGTKVLCSVLGGYSNVARVVFVWNQSENVQLIIADVMNEITQLSKQHSAAIPSHKATFNIIVQDGQSLGLREFQVSELEDIDNFISTNYNDDFSDVSTQIVDGLNTLNKGITLLHGVPGSGKTNFIRYLAHKVKSKTLIYIPPEMTSVLVQPSFISFVMENSGSIFIIEDAESILQTREAGDNSAVANLLNMSDGIIGDAVQCQFVCTFNCEFSQVDNALKRKGRLNSVYQFSELEVPKAQALVDKLYPASNHVVSKPLTLAEIYNLYVCNGGETMVKKTHKLGF